jgi:hypothetical protein
MSVYSCLQEIIGFTRNEDACVDIYNSSYSNSDSGLYLDELPGMSLRILGSTGGNTTLWQKFGNARENAINAFKVDVLKEILKTKEPVRQKFIGNIGGKSFSSKLGDDTYQGLRMYSDVIGGTFTLRGVTLILDTAESVTLEVYTGPDDEDGQNSISHFHLTSLAGRAKYNAVTPTTFDLEGDLYFLYNTITGLPYNNQLTCNCGGFKWCFDPSHPCYRYSRDKWTEWAMVAGVHGSDLSIRDDWGTSREARGLILHGDFGCDTLGILCSDHSDWTGNMVDAAIAWSVLYKTGSFLSSYIMDSEEVNRYTLLGVDGLSANIIFYETKYKEMVEFIAENIEDDRNECLKCRNPHGYKRQSQML